jgi:hypothetical protein
VRGVGEIAVDIDDMPGLLVADAGTVRTISSSASAIA